MNIHLISLGCAKNTVDSEIMAGFLLRGGHRLTAEAAGADAIIVNTCGFIEPAKRESLDQIFEVLKLRQAKPGLKVIVAGCLSERYRRELAAQIPEVDAWVGVNEIGRIGRVVAGLSPGRERPALYLQRHDTPRRRLTPAHYGYVKILEGCSHRCTFCAIPAIRGPLRSRPPEDILAEIRAMVRDGCREVILIGQDTTAYGRDGNAGISALLDQAAAIDGDFWIRLMYTYPGEVGEDLLATLARHPKICPYLDLPLQHAHPEVLRRMGRGGAGDDFLRLLERARDLVPGLAVRTSLITGFPGETRAHFQHLLDFVRAARFDHLGVFCYSDEEGTAAYELGPKVTPATAARRRDRLMEAQLGVLREQSTRWLGRTCRVLVDGRGEGENVLIQARLPQQAPEVDSQVYLVDGDLEQLRPGEFATVRLKRYLEYDFSATVLRTRRP